MLVVRLRDTAFKRALATMPLGAPLQVEGPFDDLRLEGATGRPLALVAGGVAIAPFLGFLRQAASAGRWLQATLFYSCRRPEDAPFLQELIALSRAVRGLRVVPTMTRLDSSSDWAGERRRLGLGLFGAYLPALVGPAYRIAGSSRLISQLTRELERAGVPLGDVEIEMYTSY